MICRHNGSANCPVRQYRLRVQNSKTVHDQVKLITLFLCHVLEILIGDTNHAAITGNHICQLPSAIEEAFLMNRSCPIREMPTQQIELIQYPIAFKESANRISLTLGFVFRIAVFQLCAKFIVVLAADAALQAIAHQQGRHLCVFSTIIQKAETLFPWRFGRKDPAVLDFELSMFFIGGFYFKVNMTHVIPIPGSLCETDKPVIICLHGEGINIVNVAYFQLNIVIYKMSIIQKSNNAAQH